MSGTTRKRRVNSLRHPLLTGRPTNVWHSDLAGLIPGYPRTAEGFQRRQQAASEHMRRVNEAGKGGTRKGVPDGWAGRRAEAEAERKRAAEKAKTVMAALIAKGLEPVPTTTDEEKAHRALEVAISMVLDPTLKDRERSAAARIVLDFTRPKPVTRKEVTAASAEEWLNELIN